MTTKIKKLTVILLAFAVIFTSLPLMAGNCDVYAASKKAKKKITASAMAMGQNCVKVSWNKIKDGKGYAVFRNGMPVAHLGKGATSYTDSGLSAGTSYAYQIKSYTKKMKKKKGKKTVKYSYKKKSNATYATTAAPTVASKPVVTPAPGTGNGSNVSPAPSQPSTGQTTKTVTDYKGVQRTFNRGQYAGGYYWCDDYITILEDEWPRYDRTVDGTWTEGNKTFVQRNGVTICL